MPKRQIETYEWLDMLSRMIRAAGKRVGAADEHELAKLVDIQREFEAAVQTAVDAQIASGRSWSYIGNVLGISKQAAFKRFGRPKHHVADSISDRLKRTLRLVH